MIWAATDLKTLTPWRQRAMSSESDDKSEVSAEDANKSRSVFGSNLPLERETAWFILISVLDILLTYRLLGIPGVGEANPIARYFIYGWGAKGMIFYKMGMVAFITVLAQVIATKNLKTARYVLFFGITVNSIVVVYSFRMLIELDGLF